MKALTIQQPWASLIAIGAKRIETRSWNTSYRGKVAIHAGQKWTGSQRALLDDYTQKYASAAPLRDVELPRGQIIAIATLYDVIPVDIASDFIHDDERAYGDYSTGRYAWMLDDVQPIEPVAAKGRLGLWNWEREGA